MGSSGLIVEDLSRRFGKRWAVARVQLEVPRGTALMLTGPNGSGKTTLLRCLATALRPHHGRASFDDIDLWQRRDEARSRVGFLSHQTRQYGDLSAVDNLTVWARLGGLRADIPALLARVGLPTDRPDPVRTFSAGMKRRLSLARSLLRTPELLLLDEPFAAFDPAGQDLVRGVITEALARKAAVVVTTHVPDLTRSLCTAHAHLEDGQVASLEAL